MVDKKAVLIATIIVIIIVGGLIGINLYKLDKTEKIAETSNNTNSNTSIKATTINTENTTKNEIVQENKTSKNETKTDEKSKDENKTKNETSKTNKKEPEDIAIEIVKEKMGNQFDNVYFNVDEKDKDGKYIVSVRNKETTTEMASYKVDIENKIVTEN